MTEVAGSAIRRWSSGSWTRLVASCLPATAGRQDARTRYGLTPRPERNGEQWVCRKVASNGIVSVGYQQVSVGKNYSGSACDVLVTDGLLQFWVGSSGLTAAIPLIGAAIRILP